MNDIDDRLRRIYSAMDAVVETDLTAFAVTRGTSDGLATLGVDFRGGLSDEQLANLAHILIHNVPNLKGHLRRCGKTSGLAYDRIAGT